MRQDRHEALLAALREVAHTCPRLVRECYWAGASSIALEDLSHRESFDLDFHTLEPMVDVRPIPQPYGSGFSGVLSLPDGEQVTLQVMANFDEVPASDLTSSRLVPGLRRGGVLRPPGLPMRIGLLHDVPGAYEVEFPDGAGRTIWCGTLLARQIRQAKGDVMKPVKGGLAG